MAELRPVIFRRRGDDWDSWDTTPGWFHQWVIFGDKVYAIIEKDDGTTVLVSFRDVKFTDKKGE